MHIAHTIYIHLYKHRMHTYMFTQMKMNAIDIHTYNPLDGIRLQHTAQHGHTLHHIKLQYIQTIHSISAYHILHAYIT